MLKGILHMIEGSELEVRPTDCRRLFNTFHSNSHFSPCQFSGTAQILI